MAVILWLFLGISTAVCCQMVGVCCLDNEIFAVCCYVFDLSADCCSEILPFDASWHLKSTSNQKILGENYPKCTTGVKWSDVNFHSFSIPSSWNWKAKQNRRKEPFLSELYFGLSSPMWCYRLTCSDLNVPGYYPSYSVRCYASIDCIMNILSEGSGRKWQKH